MSTENKIDLNTPPSEQEITDWVNGLSDADRSELRRQQIHAAAVNRKPSQAPDLGAMTQAQFDAYKRQFGF